MVSKPLLDGEIIMMKSEKSDDGHRQIGPNQVGEAVLWS